MRDSALTWQEEESGTAFRHVTDMLLVTQYLDTLAAVGSNELILRHGPQEVLQSRNLYRSDQEADEEDHSNRVGKWFGTKR